MYGSMRATQNQSAEQRQAGIKRAQRTLKRHIDQVYAGTRQPWRRCALANEADTFRTMRHRHNDLCLEEQRTHGLLWEEERLRRYSRHAEPCRRLALFAAELRAGGWPNPYDVFRRW